MSRLRFHPSSTRTPWTMSRWLVWMPALMVGALFYWTVALGMGGLSLVAVSALAGAGGEVIEGADQAVDTTTSPTVSEEAADTDEAAGDAIVVHLEEAAPVAGTDHGLLPIGADDDGDSAGDVNDNAGAVAPPIEATAVEPMSGSTSGL